MSQNIKLLENGLKNAQIDIKNLKEKIERRDSTFKLLYSLIGDLKSRNKQNLTVSDYHIFDLIEEAF